MSEVRGGLGLADHNEDFYFYSECIEKLLESFRQRYGIIQFMFLKYKAICHKHYVILAMSYRGGGTST